MYAEKRPTCVTVIGWAWIVIGGLMCLSVILSLTMFLMIFPLSFILFPLFDFVKVGVFLLGLISGINFLKLKSWSRNVLEILTWLLLFFIVVFSIFDIISAVMRIIINAIYAILLVIMIKYLRSDKVKNAMIVTTKSAITLSYTTSTYHNLKTYENHLYWANCP